jgi:RNA ligase
MGYMHIDNLYKNQSVLMFKRCYALEKVHGTSAHVCYNEHEPNLRFFSGGEKHASFVALFDHDDLRTRIAALGHADVTIYGEAYGGKQQGMRATYGDALCFIAFDVRVGDAWLSVPDAAQVVEACGLEFVPFMEVSTGIDVLNLLRDAPSEVSGRRLGPDAGPRAREGIVIRPLTELTNNNGHRIIAKHKCDAFSERATPQKVVDPSKIAVLTAAADIAQEWVTPMRLSHVLDKLGNPSDMTATGPVIRAMLEDVYREGVGEVVESAAANAAIGKRTAQLFKDRLRSAISPA